AKVSLFSSRRSSFSRSSFNSSDSLEIARAASFESSCSLMLGMSILVDCAKIASILATHALYRTKVKCFQRETAKTLIHHVHRDRARRRSGHKSKCRGIVHLFQILLSFYRALITFCRAKLGRRHCPVCADAASSRRHGDDAFNWEPHVSQ